MENKLLSHKTNTNDCDFKRIGKLTSRMYQREAKICSERALIYTQSFKDNHDEPMIIKKAKAFKETLEKMTIYIEPDSLILGNQASSNFTAPIFPEYSIDWIIEELDEFDKRTGDSFFIDEKTKEDLKSIQSYWSGNTHMDKVLENLNDINLQAEDQGVLHRGGISMSGDGHIIPNYEFVIEHGFVGMKNIAKEKLLNSDLTKEQKDFYKSVIISMDGVMEYCNRFSLLCKKVSNTKDFKRKQELETLSTIFYNLSNKAPESFYEVVQITYLVHLLMMVESNGHSFSYGRFDDYAYDAYKKDLDANIINKDKALEIMTHFFIMSNSINKIRPWGHTQYSGGYPLYSNLNVGGLLPDGSDITNDLSYLALEAMALTGLPEPNLSIRYHKNSPKAFLKDAAKLISKGFGMPALFNDEVVIPAMMSLGLSEEIAREYSSMGCVETAIPGRWGHRATGMTYVNFGKILELVLNNGYDPKSNIQLISINGEEGRDIEYESYEEMFAAWEKLLKFYSNLAIDCDIVCDTSLKHYDADPFASATINDSLKRGKTLKNGGSEYDYVSSSNIGPSVVGDSFASINKNIFEEKRYTFKQLREILDNNFEGLQGAIDRKILQSAPKFGNDDDYVDNIVSDVFNSYLKLLPEFKTERFNKGPIGCGYTMSTSNITSYVPNGLDVGATPDGRYANKPLNEGCSPSLGADKNGPTAIINSVAKLPNKKMAGGQLLNMRFSPSALAGEDNLNKFVSFIIASGKKNIFHNQFNIVDTETLKKAKANPEEYPDLMVRVAGYCALFNTLMPEHQDAIIERTELSW